MDEALEITTTADMYSPRELVRRKVMVQADQIKKILLFEAKFGNEDVEVPFEYPMLKTIESKTRAEV